MSLNRILVPVLTLALAPITLHAQRPAAEQIAAAVLAAPADRRDGAAVLGYDAAGEFTTLREGTNDMICLADDPAAEGFETACYHVSLEPFMARGRELAAAGVTGRERTQARYREIEAGSLKMPDRPAMLYVLTGERFDAESGAVTGEYRRSVMYVPFATAEATGLSTSASTVDPWIMFPGTAGAHIMITPPRNRSGG
jgi:hypothetical protein